MAEAKQQTFEAVMKALKEKKYAPIYYLMGEEAYYIDKISDYIAEHVLAPEERDFNQTILFGSDVTAAAVADMARRYPMMAEHQVVIVKEAQNIRNMDALEQYLKNPQPSTILVLCHKNGVIDRRKRITGVIEKVGVLFESKKLRERDLLPFIEKYLQQKGASIDNKSQQMIADAVGADLNRLTAELDKLLIGLPADNKRITPQVVEQQIGVSKDFNAYELRDALVNRNVHKANQIIKYFANNPKAGSAYSLIPMLFNYFQTLMIAYYCPQRTNPEALAQWLGMRNAWNVRDYLVGMEKYKGVKVMQIISKIREIDAKSKGLDNPSTSSDDLMQELIFFILH